MTTRMRKKRICARSECLPLHVHRDPISWLLGSKLKQGKTEKELFRPVPGICPAPLAMDASTHAFLQQDNDFPGSAALIQGLMSCPAAGCREAIDGEQDGIVGPGGADVVTDIDEMMLDQWLDAVLAATESFASVQFELLAPFFFRLAVFSLGLFLPSGLSFLVECFQAVVAGRNRCCF